MGNVEIDGKQLQQAIELTEKIKFSLTEAYDSAESLIQYVGGAEWSGKTRNHFLTYMELILQYHHEMEKVAKKHAKALIYLQDSIESFPQENIVKEVMKL